MTRFESAKTSSIPMLGIGRHHLRVQLSAQGVKLSLCEECVEDFICDASAAVARTRKIGEPYLACLRRHIDARVRFILLWTHTDEKFDMLCHDRGIVPCPSRSPCNWRAPSERRLWSVLS